MLIALLSDIHDRTDHLEWALEEIKRRGAEKILCLGDIVSPFTARILARSAVPVFSIFGNNEGDRSMFARVAMEEGSSLVMADREFAEIEIEGGKYFLAHYPELAEHAGWSGEYSAVFHGHTHRKREEKIHNTPIINPGEIAGVVTGTVSFALFDTNKKSVQYITL